MDARPFKSKDGGPTRRTFPFNCARGAASDGPRRAVSGSCRRPCRPGTSAGRGGARRWPGTAPAHNPRRPPHGRRRGGPSSPSTTAPPRNRRSSDGSAPWTYDEGSSPGPSGFVDDGTSDLTRSREAVQWLPITPAPDGASALRHGQAVEDLLDHEYHARVSTERSHFDAG